MAVKKFRMSIFPPKTSIDDVIATNGIVLDSILVSCTDEEECSTTGDFTLDAEFINDGVLSKLIDEDCIIKVLQDYGYEIFRIVKYNPKLKRPVIMAKQYTIEAQKDLWLDDVRPTNLKGQAALNHMLTNAVGVKDINVYSDIDIESTAYYNTMSLYEACFDCDRSFIDRWGTKGLEVTRRGKNIYLNTKRGLNKNLTVRERKNLTGFSGNRNRNSYITRALGIGYDGIKGHYIDSPLIDNYSRVKTDVFKYEDVKLRTSDMTADEEGMIFDTLEEAQAELDKRIKLEFSENHVDEIKATYNVDFVQLSQCEEYKEYAYLEEAQCGDYVKVNIPSLDIDIIVRVMTKKYDVLRQKTIDMQLSNTPVQTTISTATILNNLKKEYDKTGNVNINDYITAIINAGLQNSHVIVRPNEILIMDTKDINTAKNVWRWNSGALAHSNNGYYSKDWNVGITQDGMINAERILTGILSAIIIQNYDGSFQIDLSKSGGCNFLSNGKLALDIQGTALNFYNFLKEGEKIGELSTKIEVDSQGQFIKDRPFIDLSHERNSMMRLSYRGSADRGQDPSLYYPYMEFDIEAIRKVNNKAPISVYRNIGFLNYASIYMYGNDHEYPTAFVGMSDSNNMCLMCGIDFNVMLGYMQDKQASSFKPMVVVNKDGFKAYGDKNCIQVTDKFGEVKYSSVEDIGAYLTWREYGGIYETKKSNHCEYYVCIVKIPEIIKETIDTKGNYDVYVNAISSFTRINVFSMKEDYFYVKSEEPCRFNFVLTGRRKGFEARSLEEQILEAEKFNKEKQKEIDRLIQVKARTSRYFKINKIKRDYKLWAACGRAWADYGECYEN